MSDQRPSGASARCPHPHLHFHLNDASFGNTNLRYLEIRARCEACGQAVKFRGPIGMGPQQAMVSLDGEEVRVPFLIGDETLTGNPASYHMKAGGKLS